jgi:hypothetical protein
MEVKSRALNTQGQLPLNLCIKQNIKNQMGTYQVMSILVNILKFISLIKIRFTIKIFVFFFGIRYSLISSNIISVYVRGQILNNQSDTNLRNG